MAHMMQTNFVKTFIATLLVSGTCIGSGVLALPLEAKTVGFWPSIFILLLSYVFMTMTGLLYAEASLWMKEKNAHLATITKHLLGRWGSILAILFYLFMGYLSLVTYNSGGSIIIANIIDSISQSGVEVWAAAIGFALVFGLILYLGVGVLGKINTIFVVGLITSFVCLISIGLGDIRSEFLIRFDWDAMYFIIPLMIASFSYQMIVPSLTLYLEHDVQALKRAIKLGTSISAIVYILWILLALGMLPNLEGHQQVSGLIESENISQITKYFANSNILALLGTYFAFFAIVTSYLGITLGLYDFLSDLMGVDKRGFGKLSLCLLVVLPALYFAIIFPKTSIKVFAITGGFGDSILNGILPIFMVWMGRYVIGYEKGRYRFFWGKPILIVLFLFSLIILGAQVLKFVV